MTLAARTKRLARSWAPDNQARRILLPVGLALGFAGVTRRSPTMTALGALLVGWAANPDPNRYYLEGFSDGLAAEPDLRAAAPAVEAGPGAALRGLPGQPRPDDPGAADGTRHRAWSDDRAGPAAAHGIADAIGVEIVPRPARQPFDNDGNPISIVPDAVRREAGGPRRSSFGAEIPAIEPARVTGIEHTNGATSRRQARPRRRAPEGKTG